MKNVLNTTDPLLIHYASTVRTMLVSVLNYLSLVTQLSALVLHGLTPSFWCFNEVVLQIMVRLF